MATTTKTKATKMVAVKAAAKKACTLCEKDKSADTKNFYPRETASDGLSSWCRECARKKHKAYVKQALKQLSKTARKGPRRAPVAAAQAHA